MADSLENNRDPADPYRREAQTFPHLTSEMIERLGAYGTRQTLADGEIVFRRGERTIDCFVILTGALELFDRGADGEETTIAFQDAGQFTGEIDLLNDRQILVSAKAVGETLVLRIPRQAFRRLLSAEPEIGELILRALILRRVALISHVQGAALLIGEARDTETVRLRRFLIRNAYPHKLLEPGSEDGAEVMAALGLASNDLPAVIADGETVLRRPDTASLAEGLGLLEEISPTEVFDLAVVGAGPAGLAAAVYAASEGLATITVEGNAPGGQAGTSSKIENYLGFPTGISGQALAGRAAVQAQKFGARLAVSRPAVRLDCAGRPFELVLAGGAKVRARAVVVATGAVYQKLHLENYEHFEGRGIHYAASAMEAQMCVGEDVVVIGGGNSAGQAAMFLSRHARHVHMLIRAESLSASMSDYLVQRIALSSRITLHARTELTRLEGGDRLARVEWFDHLASTATTKDVGNVFVMIGAKPNTEWLTGCVPLDGHGFILTGQAVDGTPLASPYMTPVPGMFAVGDVRSGSVKRVASGVGEGSVVIQAVHKFLADDPA